MRGVERYVCAAPVGETVPIADLHGRPITLENGDTLTMHWEAVRKPLPGGAYEWDPPVVTSYVVRRPGRVRRWIRRQFIRSLRF